MTRLLIALFLVPASLALAAEQKPAAPTGDPMAGWVPPKLANPEKDKKEIQALIQAMDAASKRGDIDAAAALIDFPVLMATDDSKGEGMAEAWERERWIEMMKPFYSKPMADMKVTRKPDIFLLSDSLATVNDVCTVKMGPKTVTMRNSTLVLRRDGKWLVKGMAEAGWGDMPQMQDTAPGSGTASPGAGNGAGTGGGVQEPPPTK
jgi:ketosteroid isomerase-like protein